MAGTPARVFIEEVQTELSPVELFGIFRPRKHCFFLDSGMDPAKLGRYSFMGAEPFLTISSRGGDVSVEREGRMQQLEDNPFDVLGEFLREYQAAPPGDLPFTGGAVGYFSYDLCHFIEKLPKTAVEDLGFAECFLGFYDGILVVDNLSGKVFAAAVGFPELDEAGRYTRAKTTLAELRNRVTNYKVPAEAQTLKPLAVTGITLKSNFSRQYYLQAVATAREYISAGDIFQVNISQRFETALPIAPFELYRRLREINPAPFASYLDTGDMCVVGASPERFLKVNGREVETRPIKGTRPRGQTPAEDQALAAELMASAKDRAENVMIVDLERNDVGRVCRFGSVRVTGLAELEEFPTVFHLTSTVVGELAEGKDRIDLLKATFPGGSITGAPKVRAMEIIDELEPTRRSVYTGSIGYLGFDGNMDLNIVIRTILVKNNKAYFQVGGGIVYDSVPEQEYQETLDKARALIEALSLSPRAGVEITG
ncbi:aminodeoxychorismate synthase component I [Chloroflexota bacterium]